MNVAAMAQAVAAASPIVPEKIAVQPGRAVHIDGDMICYFAGGNEDTTVAASRNIMRRKVDQFIDAAGAERAVLHLTASGSAKGDRYHVATVKPYQQQRKGAKRPKNWEYLREYCQEQGTYAVKVWADREADDGFGYITSSRPNDVIATADKDMRMLWGFHLSWQTASLTYVPPGTYRMDVEIEGKVKEFGPYWFFKQMLQGDTADHIPGLPLYKNRPIGEAGAARLLRDTATPADGANVIVQAYHEHYGDDAWDRIVEQAALLWIRTDKAGHLLNFVPAFAGLDQPEYEKLTAAAYRLYTRVEKAKKELADVFATAPAQGR